MAASHLRCSQFLEERGMEDIKIVFDSHTIERYAKHYFELHPRARNAPIQHPYHESINKWMIMKRIAMNALKQKWKDFICWLVNDEGYANLKIDTCIIEQIVFYGENRRIDIDNSTPKFILDGLVESGLIVDDSRKHITKLILSCEVDRERPRTEIYIRNIKLQE